jgi:tRNA pseudouridine synthase 10
MTMLKKAQEMLEVHPLCDNCLGRQFALTGYGLTDKKRGETLKLLLTMENHQSALCGKDEGFSALRTVASNGSFEMAAEILNNMRKKSRKPKDCYLCQGLFKNVDSLAENAVNALESFEYTTFLVGVELPTVVEEREDEFKARFEVG